MSKMDSAFPHLSNAPIVEAVIDIRIQSDHEWDEDKVKETFKDQLDDYPVAEEQRTMLAEFTTNPEQKPHANTKDLGLKGFVFRADDNSMVAQFQKEGFTFSKLKPYNKWELFTTEAKRLWDIYCETVSPINVARLGVRFINRISFLSSDDINDYLRDAPQPPIGSKWIQNGFIHRNIFKIPEELYQINMVKVLEKTDDHIYIILDNDVFIIDQIELDDVWSSHFDKMRYYKNKIFFANITEKYVEEIK